MQKNVYEFISTHTNDPIVERRSCKRCTDEFAITQKDLDILDKISPVIAWEKKLIPPPTLCPDCRRMRRLAFRNERKFYKKKCDATGRMMISMFSPDVDVLGYDSKNRNEDCGNGLKYGQNPDFSRSFMDQFYELSRKVPKRIISNAITLENCEYSNYGIASKDCYLSAGIAFSEKCHYSYSPLKGLQDMDGYVNIACQYTYDCVECMMWYKLYYSHFSTACKDSAFLYDCVNCDHCFGCVNLVGKKYCFKNQQLTPEEYQSKVDAIMGSHLAIEQFKKEFHTFTLQFPKSATRQTKAENCIGNHLINTKDCVDCFSIINDCENIRHSAFCGEKWVNLMDCYQTGVWSQWIYEAMGCTRGYKSAFVYQIDPVDTYYSEWIIDAGWSSNLFLSSGLKFKHNVLLNKEYQPKERESLVARVIEKMKADGERGESFPLTHSPHPLNDTQAMEYFPIYKVIDATGQESIFNEKGKWTITLLESEKFISKAILDLWGEKIQTTWRTKDIDVVAPQWIEIIQAKDLPDHIKDVDDTILDKAIICEVSWRPYRLIKQELDFYREHNIPLPRKHYESRFVARLASLPPMKLFLRNCDKCWTECLAVYDKDYPGNVFCEQCYTKEIYW